MYQCVQVYALYAIACYFLCKQSRPPLHEDCAPKYKNLRDSKTFIILKNVLILAHILKANTDRLFYLNHVREMLLYHMDDVCVNKY